MDSSLVESENKKKYFGNILIIGLGMIGGSFAKALKNKKLAYVYGADRRREELTLGLSTQVIDESVELTKEIVEKMDVILLATPVRAIESILVELKPLLATHTLVTDVGSTKGSVLDAVKSVFGETPPNFILGHPIAGAEKSGVLAANPHLFEEHKVILTPQPNSDPVMLDTLHRIWTALGAEVLSMDVDQHDHVLANSSHLPHLLAYTLVDSLANNERSQDIFRFAAGGFRDFTRIASSDPTMWRDVFLANREATLASLDNFTDHLQQMRTFIEKADTSSMFGVFTRAKSARDHLLRLQTKNDLMASTRPVSFSVFPSSLIKGKPCLFGDKNLSHLAIVVAALAEGVSDIINLDQSNNVKVTLQALQDMGVVIERFDNNHFRVHGVGLQGLKAPIAPINIHQSRLSLHLLLPVLAKQSFAVDFVADNELLVEPFTELLSLVDALGVKVQSSKADCLPFSVDATVKYIENYQAHIGIYSEQIKLAALMAGIMSQTKANISFGPEMIIDNTERLLTTFGYHLAMHEKYIGINRKQQKIIGTQIVIPSDNTKVSWLALLASLLPGSNLELENIFISSKRESFLGLLMSIGGTIKIGTVDKEQPEFINELQVGFGSLQSFSIEEEQLNLYRNELLLLCVAAVYASGTSRIEGVNTLPYYWQDRILAFIDALKALDVPCKLELGILEISGQIPNGGELDCAGDYDLALAMLALGVRSRDPITVHDCQKLLEEFEEFEAVTKQVGFYCQMASH